MFARRGGIRTVVRLTGLSRRATHRYHNHYQYNRGAVFSSFPFQTLRNEDESRNDSKLQGFHTLSFLQIQTEGTSTNSTPSTTPTTIPPFPTEKKQQRESSSKSSSPNSVKGTNSGVKRQSSVKKRNKEVSNTPSQNSGMVTKIGGFVKTAGGYFWMFIKNPLILGQWGRYAWVAAKDMAAHTWTGFKLLGVEVQTSWNLLKKKLNGHNLTRRERRQLLRTTADLARVVPFLFFILVPFMEFLLPIALKIFPNMLPSTFQDNFKREEDMKRQLKLRIELAAFLQDMVGEMEQRVKSRSDDGDEQGITIQEVQLFMERVRMGGQISEDTVLRVAKLFSDELTTDNMSRSQLINLCQFMGLPYFGGDAFLRFQLRSRISSLRDDDATIFFEGVESLNLLELKQACQDRGMRATGLTMHQLRTQLKRWIDLSVNKNVPLSLLILSRAFTLQHSEKTKVELAISEAISQMDEDVLQEALVHGGETKGLLTDPNTLSKMKLDAIYAQNELIEREIKEKSRKKEFLEQLRLKAQEELEAAQQAHLKQVEAEQTQDRKLSKLDEEIVLEPEKEDIASPLVLESGEVAKQEAESEKLADTLETIKVLASDSSLEDEREILEAILEKQEEIDALKAVDSGRIIKTAAPDDEEEYDVGVAGEQVAPEKRSSSMLKKKISSMLEKLEVDVETADEQIGKKFKVLDLDHDGIISSYELREALLKAFKSDGGYTSEMADEVINKIDVDKDGIISLDELGVMLEKLRKEREGKSG